MILIRFYMILIANTPAQCDDNRFQQICGKGKTQHTRGTPMLMQVSCCIVVAKSWAGMKITTFIIKRDAGRGGALYSPANTGFLAWACYLGLLPAFVLLHTPRTVPFQHTDSGPNTKRSFFFGMAMWRCSAAILERVGESVMARFGALKRK